jgi:hypothetical protein
MGRNVRGSHLRQPRLAPPPDVAADAPEQPSSRTAIKKGDPLGRLENEVEALISPERDL